MSIRALFGGTFDPIHQGHIETARALLDELDISTLHLMPNAVPPHRPQPLATAAQRLAMVELACESDSRLVAEAFELRSSQPSYTAKTLQHFKQHYPHDTLLFVMGMDSLVSLDSWYQWRTLTEFAHIIVMPRPGYELQQASHTLQEFIQQHRCQRVAQLHQQSHGCIYLANTPLRDISATEIRARLLQLDIESVLPAKVADYIAQQRLYR